MAHRTDALPSPRVEKSFFRARETISFQGIDDALRIVEAEGALLIAVANAYDSGFSTCFPAGSRLLLDLVEQAWAKRGTFTDLKDRARHAFDEACKKFIAKFDSVPPTYPPGDEWADSRAASLTLCLVQHNWAHCIWRGAESVVVVRGDTVVRRLPVHTLANQFRAKHPEGDLAEVPDVLTSTVGHDGCEPDETTWPCQPGDAIWVLGGTITRADGADFVRPDWPTGSDINKLLGQPPTPYVAGVLVRVMPLAR